MLPNRSLFSHWLTQTFCLVVMSCPGPIALAVADETSANAQTPISGTKDSPYVSARVEPGDRLIVLPDSIKLYGPQAKQKIIVAVSRDGQIVGQITNGLKLKSSNASVLEIIDGNAVAKGNGAAEIVAEHDGLLASASVEVAEAEQEFSPSFRIDVQSVLSKAGCNSGACHGAAAGKNGFKLSLRGYDTEGDYLFITRQARGRRIVPSDPGRSLLLMKPTGAVPHKGGKRFDVDSDAYRTIAAWIARGAAAPKGDDPHLDRLIILPKKLRLEPGMRQEITVLAHYTDGRSADVTRWCRFSSTNESVAAVSEDGQITVMGHGEGAVSAWYMSQNVVATVSVPYPHDPLADVFASVKRQNFIDEIVLRKLQGLNIPPSPPAGDGEFLRRAFLDTLGVLPTVEETKAFLADESPHKRDKLIDSLLRRPEFVDYWAYKWSDLLLVNSGKLSPPAMWAYYHWIRDRVAANTPWDEIARQVVTATGSTLENGAANFFILHKDPRNLAENTSMAFLGMSIECARCHNHPLEKWTNDQYYGFANLFSRVRQKDAAGDGNVLVYTAERGDLTQPRTGRPQPPRPLDAKPTSMGADDDRRVVLADWLTSPNNPYFGRAIANRIWANYLGVGLVENVDDLRLTNPASNEELLSALADFLRENGFDLKELMRAILTSSTYQRSSKPLEENKPDKRYYSRYYPRRLMAEVMLDSISQVTDVPTEFPGYPKGWRALELPDTNVASYFLESFGRPQRNITCECERTAQPSVSQVLHLSNGDVINQKLAAEESVISQHLGKGLSEAEIIDHLFLAALCRHPTSSEKKELCSILEQADDNRRSIEDLYWGVLSTREFLFNH